MPVSQPHFRVCQLKKNYKKQNGYSFAVSINCMLIFSQSSAPLEWVICSILNVCFFPTIGWDWHKRDRKREETRRGFESERRGIRVGSYICHTRSRFSGLLLFRVVGVKTGCALMWSGDMSKSVFVCVCSVVHVGCWCPLSFPVVLLVFTCFKQHAPSPNTL